MATNGVEFDEDSFSFGNNREQPQQPAGQGAFGNTDWNNVKQNQQNYPHGQSRGMVGWLIHHGLAKTERGAQIWLLVAMFINVAITIVVIKFLVL